jgi:hypothetical protein
MIAEGKHLFICMLAFCVSSLEKCLCPLPIFKPALVLVSCGSLYIMDIDSSSDKWFANIFSHYTDCLFALFVSFAVLIFF